MCQRNVLLMRSFFKKKSDKKSAKPIIVIRILMVVTMGIFFVLRIIDGWISLSLG